MGKEWKGRLLMPNPFEGSVMANSLQTILNHPKEMAAAYQAELGKPLKYSSLVNTLCHELAHWKRRDHLT